MRDVSDGSTESDDGSQRIGTRLRVVSAFGIAVFLVLLLVYAVGWEEVLEEVSETTPVYLLAFVSTTVCLVFRSSVWSKILSIVGEEASRVSVFSVFLTSTFMKYVTPYGQVVAPAGVAAVLSRNIGVEYERSAATVVSADFLNYVPYYTFGGVSLAYFVLTVGVPRLGGYGVVLVGLLAAVGVVVFVFWRRRGTFESALLTVTSPLRRAAGFVSEDLRDSLSREKMRDRLEGFYATLELVSKDRRGVVGALVLAHVGWLFLMLPLYIAAASIGDPVPLHLAVLVVALSKLGFLVPLPGGLGGVELTIAAVLVLVAGVPADAATAIALLFRLSTYWYSVVVGGLSSVYLAAPSSLSG